jgi:hypothetical protein
MRLTAICDYAEFQFDSSLSTLTNLTTLTSIRNKPTRQATAYGKVFPSLTDSSPLNINKASCFDDSLSPLTNLSVPVLLLDLMDVMSAESSFLLTNLKNLPVGGATEFLMVDDFLTYEIIAVDVLQI